MECKNDDVHEAKKYTDKKDIKSKIAISPNKKNNLENKLKNNDACEVKYKDEDIGNDIKSPKNNNSNENNNSMEELKMEDSYEIKCKAKGTDLESELKDDLTPKVKFKDKDIEKKIETLQNKSDVKKVLKNKFIRKVGSDDEDVLEDYCSEATYLARQMASAERLCQAESIVIILKEIQFVLKVL